MRDLETVVQEYALPRLKWIQEEVISSILQGEDTIGLLPTGTGKSLCFQVPGLVLQKPTLVVSPLLALMQDQVGGLGKRGIPSVSWNSLSAVKNPSELRQQLMQNDIKLLYLSPEKLASAQTLDALREIPWGVLAVDEAHCITAWGDSFRPQYLALGQLLQPLKSRSQAVTFACTATASAATQTRIEKLLGMRSPRVIASPSIRANLRLAIVRPPSAAATHHLLFRLLQDWYHHGTGTALVYVSSRVTTVRLSHHLQALGLPAQAFHAGLPTDQKRAMISEFSAPTRSLFVATCALGMGVDQPAVRLVIHYESPTDIESYAQEIGRAGRDGQTAYAIWLYRRENLLEICEQRKNAQPELWPTLKKQAWKMVQLAERNECIDQRLLDNFATNTVPPSCIARCYCNRCVSWNWRLWQT